MRQLILVFALFLTGCTVDSYQTKPVFSDSEKESRRADFYDWYSNPSAH
jgi:hypothetical protein